MSLSLFYLLSITLPVFHEHFPISYYLTSLLWTLLWLPWPLPNFNYSLTCFPRPLQCIPLIVTLSFINTYHVFHYTLSSPIYPSLSFMTSSILSITHFLPSLTPPVFHDLFPVIHNPLSISDTPYVFYHSLSFITPLIVSITSSLFSITPFLFFYDPYPVFHYSLNSPNYVFHYFLTCLSWSLPYLPSPLTCLPLNPPVSSMISSLSSMTHYLSPMLHLCLPWPITYLRYSIPVYHAPFLVFSDLFPVFY